MGDPIYQEANLMTIQIPVENLPWPSHGLRRISVNSFGFGGTNSHVIMDDAYHFLQERGLEANNRTLPAPPPLTAVIFNGSEPKGRPSDTESDDGGTDSGDIEDSTASGGTKAAQDTSACNGTGINGTGINGASHPYTSEYSVRLLVFSASDENALKRMVGSYETYYWEKVSGNRLQLDRLAYTLANRRTRMLWRTYAIVESGFQTHNESFTVAKATRTTADNGVAFVFTGQGAQYVNMGLDLLRYPAYKETIRQTDLVLSSLGCRWKIIGKHFTITRCHSSS
jgi:acyl transferase domain-containing protein